MEEKDNMNLEGMDGVRTLFSIGRADDHAFVQVKIGDEEDLKCFLNVLCATIFDEGYAPEVMHRLVDLMSDQEEASMMIDKATVSSKDLDRLLGDGDQ